MTKVLTSKLQFLTKTPFFNYVPIGLKVIAPGAVGAAGVAGAADAGAGATG